MATVYIDNKPYEMDPEQNLLHGCVSQGLNLPYFCWHPALGSVGACRQCAVKQFKDEHDTHGKIVMSCMTPAAEGTRISIADPEVTAFRAGITEGLMLNHPHDCPVCDEGGECHLQDMTVMTGHDYRRYEFDKRTFRNQDLGPLVNHEANRCIQCYRCVRYYRDYAGGRDLNAFASRNTVFFGRNEDGVLENEFSGNLVEICPTGVFTDKTLKHHYSRKWDQQFAPSVCVHCALGCNIDAGERYGTLRRVVNRYNHEVNGYFLCDRGRFGYEFVNSERRLRQPLLNGKPTSSAEARRHLDERAAGGRVIGIGSPRASLESNFALRTLVGPEHFYSGMADDQAKLSTRMIEILRRGPMRTPTLREIEECDAVFILGEDLTSVAPRMALSLRQSVRQPMEIARRANIPLWMDHGVRDALQDSKGPLYVATPYATRLDEVATATFRGAPDDLARLGFAVAHALDPEAPTAQDFPLAAEIANALKTAKRPLLISGMSCGSEAVMEAAANVAMAAHAALSLTAPECNTVGAALIGGSPLTAAFEAVKNGRADTAIILENDLYRRAPAAEVDAFLGAAKHVIVLDHLANATTQKAELELPAGTFAESDGTFISSEGRAQRFFQVFAPQNEVLSSWRWLKPDTWQNLDDVLAALSKALPDLAPASYAAPSAAFRIAGAKIPRSPHRESGRTAVLVNINISEQKTPEDPDSALSFSMEGTPDKPPAALIPFFWSPGWNSIQAVNTYQKEPGGPVRGGDAGVRMFEPAAPNGHSSDRQAWFSAIPPAFEPREGEWLLLPMYDFIGSEELSQAARGLAELAAKPYVAVNCSDLAEGAEVEVSCASGTFRLPIRLRPDLPRGVACLSAGIAPLSGVTMPAWGKIERAK
ncbi:MAG TPA: NADH-quinone oxidoreductase subunit NuoG [Candidatus Sulfotelmatobacter sp.]|nr:NADH-quinone oxidoreductase subunit NuoG [Candidatus Sulfotelmatobacter sp.]